MRKQNKQFNFGSYEAFVVRETEQPEIISAVEVWLEGGKYVKWSENTTSVYSHFAWSPQTIVDAWKKGYLGKSMLVRVEELGDLAKLWNESQNENQ